MEPNRPDSSNDQNKNNNNTPNKKPKGNFLVALLATCVLAIIIIFAYNSILDSRYTETEFNDFLKAVEEQNLAEVEFSSDRITYMTKEEAEKPSSEQKACYTGLPKGDTMELHKELEAQGVKVQTEIPKDNSLLLTILLNAVLIGSLFLVMHMVTKKISGDGMLGGMGKNNAKVYMEKQTGVTFKDVAGQDEAKESLQDPRWRWTRRGRYGHRNRCSSSPPCALQTSRRWRR